MSSFSSVSLTCLLHRCFYLADYIPWFNDCNSIHVLLRKKYNSIFINSHCELIMVFINFCDFDVFSKNINSV